MDESIQRALQLSEPRRKLLEAADLIERGGHVKHTLQAGQSFCLVGAINMACGRSSHSSTPLGTKVQRLMAEGLDYGDIVNWNNAPERTAEEVIAKMREVALRG